MERRTLLTVCGAAVVGTAGCLGFGAPGLPGSLEWSTTTEGDADAIVSEENNINLRVYKCGVATAKSDLGEIDGTLEVSFDYTVEAEEWYEDPTWSIMVDDNTVYRSGEGDAQNIEREEFETISDTVQTEVSVDGDTTLVFSIKPSSHCGNVDHTNTFFKVRDLSVNLA